MCCSCQWLCEVNKNCKSSDKESKKKRCEFSRTASEFLKESATSRDLESVGCCVCCSLGKHEVHEYSVGTEERNSEKLYMCTHSVSRRLLWEKEEEEIRSELTFWMLESRMLSFMSHVVSVMSHWLARMQYSLCWASWSEGTRFSQIRHNVSPLSTSLCPALLRCGEFVLGETFGLTPRCGSLLDRARSAVFSCATRLSTSSDFFLSFLSLFSSLGSRDNCRFFPELFLERRKVTNWDYIRQNER